MKETRVKQIAIEMVAESGLINLSRSALCERANIANGSFTYIMGCTFTEFTKTLKDIPTKANHRVIKTRANKSLRKEQILNIAIELGYGNLNISKIAENAGVSVSLVTHYWGSLKQLQRAVRRATK